MVVQAVGGHVWCQDEVESGANRLCWEIACGEWEKGVKGDFKFLFWAIGRTELPFTELSCEIFSTAYEIDRQGLRHVSDEDIEPENVHELTQVLRPIRSRSWPLAPPVLISFSCWNKIPQTQWLGTAQINYLIIMEVRSPKSVSMD